MKYTIVLPKRVVLLGEALRPVIDNLDRQMQISVERSGQDFVMLEDAARHASLYAQAMKQLSLRFDDLVSTVISNESASDSEVCRVAGRLEQVLSEFVDGYHDALASTASAESEEGRALILGVYRHTLNEIRTWLRDLVETAADPRASLKRHGVPLKSHVELTLTLRVTTPPEMERLHEIALSASANQAAEAAPHQAEPQQQRVGVLGTISAIAFGVGVTNAIWKSDPFK